MSDNLQQVYLRRLKSANEAALHGNLQECLDICSELRLKPDLTLYTRALVNLTLADACPIEDHPDKMKFAREALRLATELHDSPDQTEDAELYQDAVESVQAVENKEVEQDVSAQSADNGKDALNAQSAEVHDGQVSAQSAKGREQEPNVQAVRDKMQGLEMNGRVARKVAGG